LFRIILCAPLLVLFLTLPGCAENDSVWGMPAQTIRERLQHDDYEFLRHIDYDSLDLGDITGLADGAAYYLSSVYAELGMEDMSERMLVTAWNEGSEPWRREALLELLSRYSRAKEYGKLESTARDGVAAYPDDFRVTMYVHESYYRQEKDEELLGALEKSQAAARLAARKYPERASEVAQERLLWRAVAQYRTGTQGWEASFVALFQDYPAGPYHGRAYPYLQTNNLLASYFSASDRLLFTGKYYLSGGEYREAATAFHDYFSAEPQEVSTATVRDAGRAFIGAGMWDRGAQLLAHPAETWGQPARAAAYEYAGRMYRAVGNLGHAAAMFQAAYQHTADQEDGQRALWYLLAVSARKNTTQALAALATYAGEIQNPSYFSDLFESLASVLVKQRNWSGLWQTYQIIQPVATAAELAHYQVVLAEVIRRGKFRRNGENMQVVEQELLAAAAGQTEDLYYALLASAMLDQTPHVLPVDAAPDEGQSEAEPRATNGSDAGNQARIAEGFLDFGLYGRGFAAAKEHAGELSTRELIRLAERLQGHGNIIESLRLLDEARKKENFVFTTQTARLLYPEAYHQEVQSVVTSEKLPGSVFYGLIREESYFSPTIVSHAGAIGLSQLMPATAGDMVRRLRLENPDLTDPAANLRIGGHYLAYLQGRFPSIMYSLLAYNGGQGRVRSWMRENNDLSDLLFHEAIPLLETRNYLRKVLVSSVFYGYLYENQRPSETVHLFFRGL